MGYHSVEEIVGIIIPSNKYKDTPNHPPATCNLWKDGFYGTGRIK